MMVQLPPSNTARARLSTGKYMNFLNKLHHPTAAFHILRITLAVLMLIHGLSKLQGGITGIEGMLSSAGLPTFLAYGVYIGEVVAPALMLLNIAVVPSALVMAFNMVVALGLAHLSQVFTIGKSGGWALELQACFVVTSIAVAMMAPPCKVLNRIFGASQKR